MKIDATNLPFDPFEMPEDLDELIFLQGTWREMGTQYALQLKDTIARSIVEAYVGGPKVNIPNDVILEGATKALGSVKRDFPFLYEFIEGITDTGYFNISEAALGTIFSVSMLGPECSTLSAWGRATGGIHLAGVNGDGNWGSKSYYPSVIAFPKDGIPFFALRGLFTNCMMNMEGLVSMTSAGQCARKEDSVPNKTSMTTSFNVMTLCKTAKEAEELYRSGKIAPGSGENFHCTDRTGYSFVIEHTAGHEVVRKTGDYNEIDYLIANNHYLASEMQESLLGWPGCDTRYWSVEKIFNDNIGKITLNTFLKALSSNKYFKDGSWSEDFWELGPTDCTPENNNLVHKTHSRALFDMDNLICYRQNCGKNRANNLCPNTTGNFSRVFLKATPKEVTDAAEHDAIEQIWFASRDIDRAGMPDERNNLLNDAKAMYIAGLEYEQLSLAAEGNDAIILMSKACSQFCLAQRIAQEASDTRDKYFCD